MQGRPFRSCYLCQPQHKAWNASTFQENSTLGKSNGEWFAWGYPVYSWLSKSELLPLQYNLMESLALSVSNNFWGAAYKQDAAIKMQCCKTIFMYLNRRNMDGKPICTIHAFFSSSCIICNTSQVYLYYLYEQWKLHHIPALGHEEIGRGTFSPWDLSPLLFLTEKIFHKYT